MATAATVAPSPHPLRAGAGYPMRGGRWAGPSNSENGSEPLAGAFEVFSDEPAFLLADTALGPPDKNDTDLNDSDEDQEGDEPDELIPFTIPFNASHDSDWRPDRQLATYMLANG